MHNHRQEAELIDAFINKGIIKGWFLREVPIGRKRLRQMGIEYRMGKFYVDLVCVEGIYDKKPMRFDTRYEEFILKETKHKLVWLLEAKQELNAEVIGQILIDKHIFPEDYPQLHVKGLGIICERADEMLKDVCKRLGIQVFQN